VLLDSEMAGDEPFMLARNLPGVFVLVDKNRIKAGNYAIKHFGADTLILDDGFQYLPLKGQMQVLLVDKTNPFGNKSLLPRGILREPVRHLKRASYIFLTKSDGVRDHTLEAFIRRYNTSAEFIECTHRSKYLVDFSSMKHESLENLKGKRIAYFCAIAAPDSFASFLRQSGAQIVHHEHFLDHHRFTKTELEEFFEEAESSDAELIVTTEKDVVRIDSNFKNILPFYYTRLEIDILSGGGDFSAAVERICFSATGENPREI
jgi:tetraacyldisaccharide 4''-kinase